MTRTYTEARMQGIRGAVARGWCADKNRLKEMDIDLAEAISIEVAAHTEAEVRAMVGITLERAAEEVVHYTESLDETGIPMKRTKYRAGLIEDHILAIDLPAIAELERRDARVRLEEAQWWIECGSDREGDLSDIGRQRIAALQATADAVEKDASDV